MRSSLSDMTSMIRSRLRKDKEISHLIDVIIPVELMAVGYELMNIQVTLDEAWILLTGYDAPILPQNIPRDILVRLRMLMSTYSGEANWLALLDQYMDVKGYQRLIEIDQSFNFIFKTPRLDPGRKKVYEDILLQPIPYEESPKNYATAGKFSYNKQLGQDQVSKKGNIPKEWINYQTRLEKYRSKRKINFKMNADWLKIAREMDGLLSPSDQEWEERWQPVTFKSISKTKDVFHYDGLQHIAGGLASGKSTFRMIQTYWLVTYKSAKVGMIEGSVADVLKTVKT